MEMLLPGRCALRRLLSRASTKLRSVDPPAHHGTIQGMRNSTVLEEQTCYILDCRETMLFTLLYAVMSDGAACSSTYLQ